VDALRDAGVTNITLLDVKGTLKPLSELEQAYSTEVGVVIISEVRASLVCSDALASVAVIVGGSLILLFDMRWVDPLITILIARGFNWLVQPKSAE
jgi:hypothetical protein